MIEALPAPGEAEPRYGTFGGGFSFIFRPARDGCALTVTAPTDIRLFAAPNPEQLIERIADPLELAAEPVALLAEPIVTLGDYGILDEQPDDPSLPWRFGITGKLVRRLRAHGWDAAVPGAFSYRFMPTNVGCIARVANSRGEEIDLSSGLPW